MTATQLTFESAIRCFQASDWVGAERVCRELIQRQPNHFDARHMLGMILSRAERHAEAEVMLRRAHELQPRDAVICNNLGELLRQQGKLDEAELCFRRAIHLQPRFPEPVYNLSLIFKARGDREQTEGALRRALQLRPNYAHAHFNLANFLREEGRIKTAVDHYRHALELQPHSADTHLNLGCSYSELGELGQAIKHLSEAERLKPENLDIAVSLAQAWQAQGDLATAEQCYRRGLTDKLDTLTAQLRLSALAEVIPPHRAYVERFPVELRQTIERLQHDAPQLDLATLHSSGAEPPMALAYQGHEVCELMQRYAALFTSAIQPLELLPNSGKPRVGIVVTHGHEGVFARCWGGIAERLSRAKFDVRVICSRSGANVLKQMIRIADGEYLVLSEKLVEAAQAIRDARFDVLHYWEVGTDSTNYFLPFFQPAPRQSSTWGWPITSGNPRIQDFVSCDLIEPESASSQFSESLVRMQALPTCYERPALPDRLRDRAHYGWSAQEHLYICTQNLRKYHPDFDAILGELMNGDPLGRLLIIADAQPRITARLIERLRGSIPAVERRVQVLERMDRPEYLNVVALADVALDTLHYGGGANTVYDTVAVGTPVVSLPGAYQRGRWTLGVYRELGIQDTLASSPADYVCIARQLAHDREARRALAQRIKTAGESLFLDPRTVREHESYFERVCAEGRGAAR